MPMTDAEKIQRLHAALETAKNGLTWYAENHPELSNGCDDEAMAEIDAALELVEPVDPIMAELDKPPPPMPKARDVGRLGDMSPTASMRVGFDSDSDVFVAVYGDERDSGSVGGTGSIEFCTRMGGGRSPKTRRALIELMIAMEADNAEDPGRDWWALRGVKAP